MNYDQAKVNEQAERWSAQYPTIPESTAETLSAYVLYGRPMGGFMEAVVSNDLMSAQGRADTQNLRAFHDICRLVYNHVPMGSRGSRAAINEWIDHGGLAGLEGKLTP